MKNKYKYKVCLVLLVIAIVGALVPLLISKFKKAPTVARDPNQMIQAELKSYVESKEFTSLPIAEKAKFFEKIPRDKMREIMRPAAPPKPGERPQMGKMHRQMRKVMEYQMEQRLKKFFNASEAEQNRMLDEDIARMKNMRDEMAKRRAARQGKNGNGGNSGNGGSGAPDADGRPQRPQMDEQARRDFEASMNPATRAKMRIYFEKLRQREQSTRKQ